MKAIKRHKKLVIGLFVVIIAAAAGLTVFFRTRGTNTEAKEVKQNTISLSKQTLTESISATGTIESGASKTVSADVNGLTVKKVKVSVGDSVKKDDIIAYVDASRPGMNYSASPVKAPISGRITAIPPTVGTMVSQQTAIATISNTDILEVKINIAERFISRIKENQTGIVTFDAYPGVEFAAYAHEVSPVLDTSTRTMSVKLRFNKKDDRIKVGMYARVKLITTSIQNALIVPSAAIVKKNEEPYVFVIANRGGSQTSVRLQKVEEGISVDNMTEITDGLVAGDEIVIKGQSLLNDGSKVNVVSVSELD